jgi:hypothetical protein
MPSVMPISRLQQYHLPPADSNTDSSVDADPELEVPRIQGNELEDENVTVNHLRAMIARWPSEEGASRTFG